jgi:ATP-dependent exoDNAse (exonuclease V) alpha subunit
MTDLNKTIDWDAIDSGDAEDCGDDGKNMDFLSRLRTGVRFVPVIEMDEEVVEGRIFPPRPRTLEAAIKAYQELVAVHGPENVIVIAPFKDRGAGVQELNEAIRASLDYNDPVPRIGELLMITKNSFDRDRLNGERYRVVAVALKRKAVHARLLRSTHEIALELSQHKRGPCKDADWGYCGTVHKYQGSEAAAVIVVVPSGTLKIMTAVGGEKEPWFFDRSCLYTACSRPKLSLILVGDPHDICQAISRNKATG